MSSETIANLQTLMVELVSATRTRRRRRRRVYPFVSPTIIVTTQTALQQGIEQVNADLNASLAKVRKKTTNQKQTN
jgi:hypothetical protein